VPIRTEDSAGEGGIVRARHAARMDKTITTAPARPGSTRIDEATWCSIE